jgi:hypothetical protein
MAEGVCREDVVGPGASRVGKDLQFAGHLGVCGPGDSYQRGPWGVDLLGERGVVGERIGR